MVVLFSHAHEIFAGSTALIDEILRGGEGERERFCFHKICLIAKRFAVDLTDHWNSEYE
jgi:hypothetical protein